MMSQSRFHLLIYSISLLWFCTAANAVTVRVDPGHVAPRLLVDGKPVRARMFFGIYKPSHGATLPVTAGAREMSFTFTAQESEPKTATMHFRFGQASGDIILDNIRVVDIDTNQDVLPTCDFEGGQASFESEWGYWPNGGDNTVGTVGVEPGIGEGGSAGLNIHLVTPPDGKWPDFHIHSRANLALIKGHHYRASFWISSDAPRDLTVAFYRPGDPYLYLGGPLAPDVFASQVKLAAKAGVNFVSWMVWRLPWPAPGQPEDWSVVDAGCDDILAANPNALLIPRIATDPPEWWRKAHPTEMMRWEDSPGGNHPDTPVPASPLYRREVGDRLTAIIRHLESKYGPHMAGYHISGQNTGEWFYQDSWGYALNGYSPAELLAWHRWLEQKYPTDAALQAAWNDPRAARDSAPVPSPKARHAAPNGIFRDPKTERAIIDFNEFQQQMMADCVCDLAHVARLASGGNKLILFFYGYGFAFGNMPTGPATSGHYALRRVLDCPDIDILCSPIAYFDRGLGGNAPTTTAAESIALAGKMKLNEDDTATFLSSGIVAPGTDVRVSTLEETNEELRRNVGQDAVRNMATWWMDLGGTGWFNDPGLWAEMSRMNALDQPLLTQPVPFRPQIAAVLDEGSMLRIAQGGSVAAGAEIYDARKPLGRMGAPYGQYLLDDVAAGRVSAKVYLFLNAWCLSAQQRIALRRATRGSLLVWCYAPGLYDGDQLSPAAMQELTGFKLQPTTQQAWATPTALGRSLGLTEEFGVQRTLQPLFAATDAKPDEVLATYADGSAAVALRRTSDGQSLFVGVPGLTTQLLRLAARTAGVHLFTQTDANIYANGNYLVVHAAQPGTLRLDTGHASPVRDVLTKQTVGQGPQFSLNLSRGETRVLQIAP